MSDDVVAAAVATLLGSAAPRREAALSVPRSPGLYCVRGDASAWTQLGLVPTLDGQPLYVGKAERSLQSRDVGTHFTAGKTGSSTLRRSLAALLADELALIPVPRNLAAPDGSANFALDAASDDRLNEWMEHRLLLATWSSPEDAVLDLVETEVIRRLRPPLNLAKVGEPRTRLREARRRLAARARSWERASSGGVEE